MSDSPWTRRFDKTRYRFMRVDRATGAEVGSLRMLKGGTITRNNDVRIMETATVPVVGEFDIGNDLVRIYLDAEWPDGFKETAVLGTFIPYVPSRNVYGSYSTATVKLYGRLQELIEDKFSTPLVLPPKTNAVEAAAKICRDKGLEVIADPSDYVTTETRTYGVGAAQNNSETDDTKLGAVNDLLGLAGFWAAKTDPMGRVLLRRYVAPEDREPVWEFTEGPTAKFEREMVDERDTTSVANHVVVVYASDEETVVGEAWDRESEFSVENRGYVITASYEYTSLPSGKTPEERQAYADERAKSLLNTKQSVIRRVSITHAYAPLGIGDAVSTSYPTGGVEGKFEIRTQQLTLSGGCPTAAELRKFERKLKRDAKKR